MIPPRFRQFCSFDYPTQTDGLGTAMTRVHPGNDPMRAFLTQTPRAPGPATCL